jgi:hypothetical protein
MIELVFPISPGLVTKVIRTQRLSGACCCFKKQVFDSLEFDTNLTGHVFGEDMEFSHTLYRRQPDSLYVIPQAKVIHKGSYASRLRDPAQKSEIYSTDILVLHLLQIGAYVLLLRRLNHIMAGDLQFFKTLTIAISCSPNSQGPIGTLQESV